MKKEKVAILYIGIGKYVAFWKDFYLSFEEKFLQNSEKHYFVFTDADHILGEEKGKVHKIFQEDLGWPGNTLFRFKIFKTIIEQLKDFDYIFFMNANVVCLQMVTESMFLPDKEELVVVQHPGYYNKKPYDFDYEFSKKSTAGIPCGEGKVYVCGGVNGGKAQAYIRLIETLAENVNQDLKKGIIAKWHDESHLNHYIYENDNYKLLSPAYCYPEGWKLPFQAILMVEDKSKKIELDTKKVARQEKKETKIEAYRKKIVRQWRKMVYYLKNR